MKKIISILLIILMLCSCSGTEQPGIDLKGAAGKTNAPPELTVQYGDVSVKATMGNYSWEEDLGNGKSTLTEACGAHPLQFENIAEINSGEAENISLVFGDGMISYEICRWAVKPDYLEKEFGGYEFGAEGEKVPSENGIFAAPKDGKTYIYSINVEYESGDAEYGIRIDSADEWGITLSVSNVTATGATVIFSQSGGTPTGELITGSYYRIENADGELAYIVEGDVAWTSEAYMIPKDGSVSMNVNWEWLYGALEPGTYRIFKGVSDFRGPGDFDEKEYSAEFTVGEKEMKSISIMTIVDGAESGKLVLAGEGAGDVMTLDVNNVPVYLDGELADVSVLMDGMTVHVHHNGYILETYPSSFEKVSEIHVFSLGTKNQPGGTLFDLCGLYLKVLDDLWEVDSGLNGGAEYASIDLSAAPGGLSEGEKSAIAWIFGNKHSVNALAFTMEELKEEGYLTAAGGSDNLYQWDNGVLMSITSKQSEEPNAYFGLRTIEFNATKWRSPLGAYFFSDCSAVWPQMGTWTDYNVGAHAIS